MKKIVISLVVLLTAMQMNAQSKAAQDAVKAIDKAKAEVENPKSCTFNCSSFKNSWFTVVISNSPLADGLILFATSTTLFG